MSGLVEVEPTRSAATGETPLQTVSSADHADKTDPPIGAQGESSKQTNRHKSSPDLALSTSEIMSKDPTYTHGHHPSVLRSHTDVAFRN